MRTKQRRSRQTPDAGRSPAKSSGSLSQAAVRSRSRPQGSRRRSSDFAGDLCAPEGRHVVEQVEGRVDHVHRECGAGAFAEPKIEIEDRTQLEVIERERVAAFG